MKGGRAKCRQWLLCKASCSGAEISEVIYPDRALFALRTIPTGGIYPRKAHIPPPYKKCVHVYMCRYVNVAFANLCSPVALFSAFFATFFFFSQTLTRV